MGEVQIPKVILDTMQEQLATLQQSVNKQAGQIQQQILPQVVEENEGEAAEARRHPCR